MASGLHGVVTTTVLTTTSPADATTTSATVSQPTSATAAWGARYTAFNLVNGSGARQLLRLPPRLENLADEHCSSYDILVFC